MEEAQREELKRQVARRTRELAERNLELETANDRLEAASFTDSLTGLKNRRYLDEYMPTEIAAVRRQFDAIQGKGDNVRPLDIFPQVFFLMIDLDGFKAINDRHGHHAGDRALLQVTEILRACCRGSDTIVRWGGDEFLVVGHATSHLAAQSLAERIRVALSEHQYQLGNGHLARLSGSIGLAAFPFVPEKPGLLSWESVVAIADSACYVAKENNRNAWVAIYRGHRLGARDVLSRIRTQLGTLVDQEAVRIGTSINDRALTYAPRAGQVL
jgi:diguanylate cyclase (GGDEF)-like protein